MGIGTRKEIVNFDSVISELLEDVAPQLREATQYRYELYLGDISKDLGEKPLNDFKRKDFSAWIRELRKKKPKRNTFNDYTKFMNIVFNFSYQQKYITHNIKFPTVDGERERAGRIYNPGEIKSLIDEMNEVLLLQFILSFEGFMRLREVLHLEWGCVNLIERTIELRAQDVKTGTKTNVGRVIPMSENMYQMLKARQDREWEICKIHDTTLNRFVFPSPSGVGAVNDNSKAWESAKKYACIKGRARWHDIRHTALTHALLVLKLPVAHVSLVAGVSIRTLQRVYLHRNVDQLRIVAESMNVLKIA